MPIIPTLDCLESTPFPRLQLLLMWVSICGDRNLSSIWAVDVICALYVQVIKAAIAQVKTIADGGVTAADLTQAK